MIIIMIIGLSLYMCIANVFIQLEFEYDYHSNIITL